MERVHFIGEKRERGKEIKMTKQNWGLKPTLKSYLAITLCITHTHTQFHLDIKKNQIKENKITDCT